RRAGARHGLRGGDELPRRHAGAGRPRRRGGELVRGGDPHRPRLRPSPSRARHARRPGRRLRARARPLRRGVRAGAGVGHDAAAPRSRARAAPRAPRGARGGARRRRARSVLGGGAHRPRGVGAAAVSIAIRHRGDVALAWAVFAGLLLAHAWFSNELPRFRQPNAWSRLYLALAIAEEGRFTVDTQVARYGRVEDL